MSLSLQKHRFHAIFHRKLGHPGRLKKQIWVEKKTSLGALVTCGKTPATITYSEYLKFCCRVIVMQ